MYFNHTHYNFKFPLRPLKAGFLFYDMLVHIYATAPNHYCEYLKSQVQRMTTDGAMLHPIISMNGAECHL